MALTNDQLTITLSVDSAGAVSGFVKATGAADDYGESAKKVDAQNAKASSSFSALGSTIVIANQALELATKAWSALATPIQESIDAYVRAEAASKGLQSVLKLTSADVGASVARFEALSKQLEKTTIADDDFVLSLARQGKAMGFNDDQTEKLIRTSLDMAAALGIDVNTAFDQVAGAANGFTGRLAKVVPQLNNLTEAELKSGKGLDVIASKFTGFAGTAIDTLQGKLIKANQSFENFTEDVGQLFVELFNIAGKTDAKIEFFEGLRQTLADIKPQLLDFRDSVVNLFKAIKDAASKIDLSKLSEGLMVIGSGVIIAGLVALAPAISALAVSLVAAAAPAALLALKVTLISAIFIAAAGAVDLITKNFGLLGNVWQVLVSTISIGAAKLGQALISPFQFFVDKVLDLFGVLPDSIQEQFGGVGDSLKGMKKTFSETFDSLDKTVESSFSDINKNFNVIEDKFNGGFIGNGVSELKKFFGTAQTGFKQLQNTATNVQAPKVTKSVKPNIDNVVPDPNVVKQYEDLLKGQLDLKKQIAVFNLDEVDKIKLETQLQVEQINLLEEKLKKQNGLTDSRKIELESIKRTTIALGNLKLPNLTGQLAKDYEDLHKKIEADFNNLKFDTSGLSDLNKVNADFAHQSQILADARAEIEKALSNEQDLAKIEQLGKQYNQILNDQSKLNELNNAKEQKLGGGFGEGAADIASVFQQGAMDFSAALTPITAIMQASDQILGAVQALIDFIPQTFNKIAGIFNSLTDLPNQIASSLSNVFKSIINLITNLIPNLFKAIPQIINSVITFLFEELPKAIEQLLLSLPDIIQKLIDSLVSLLPKLISGLISTIPKLAIGLTIGLIKGIPKIIMGLVEAIPEVVDALVNGLIDGITSWINSIGDFFDFLTGGDGGPQFGPTPEEIKQTQDNINKAFNNNADTLFAVLDIQGQAKAASINGQIQQGHVEGAKKSGGILKAIWDGILKALDFLFIRPLKFTWDVIVAALTIVSKAFETIFNVIIIAFNLVIDLFKAMFDAVIIAFDLVIDLFKAVFQFASDIFMVVINLFKDMWEVVKAIFDTIINVFSALWDTVKTLFQNIVNVFYALWDFVKEIFMVPIRLFRALFEFFGKVFDDPIQAFKDLWQSVKDIFSGVFEKFGNIFEKLGNLFSDLWDGLKNIAGKLFDGLANVGSKIGDAIGNALSAVWDAIANLGSAVWDALKSAFSKVGDLLGDIGTKIWNGISDALGQVGSFFKNLFTFDGGGTGTVEDFLGFDFPWIAFAGGGKVPGSAAVPGDSLRNDMVPAMLSPGEFVLPRSVTQNKELMDGILELITGKKVQHKGFGDWISSVADTVSNSVSSAADFIGSAVSTVADFVVPDWIKDLYNSITRIINDINILDLIEDPIGTLSNAIKDGVSLLKDNFLQMMHFQDGGLVPGYGNNDTVPALLTPGEFVLNKGAVGMLNSLNSGSVGSGQTNVTVNLEINTTQNIDEAFIKNRLVPSITQELKRASLDGRFVLSSNGLRKT